MQVLAVMVDNAADVPAFAGYSEGAASAAAAPAAAPAASEAAAPATIAVPSPSTATAAIDRNAHRLDSAMQCDGMLHSSLTVLFHLLVCGSLVIERSDVAVGAAATPGMWLHSRSATAGADRP